MKLRHRSLPTSLHRSSFAGWASLVAALACGEPPPEHAAPSRLGSIPVVDKAELLTLTDGRGFPDADGPPNRPDQYAREEDSELFFLRPDTERSYYVVIPDDAPDWIFDAFVLATGDIEAASADDCLGPSVFVPMRDGAYRAIAPLELAGSSAIDVEYSEEACDGLAAGCANAPRLEDLSLSASESERRLRFGTFIGLESTYDGADTDTTPDLTPSTARAIVLHELSHTLGFSHPRYTLEPDLVPEELRVPTTAQGTVPTMMLPTTGGLGLSSEVVTADDRRALAKTYAGQCEYSPEWRSIGRLCAPPSEALCLQHGGSCEVDAAGMELCRWPHFDSASDCSSYSAGTWQGCNAFEGEAGACTRRADELSTCLPESVQTSTEDLAGRCCAQFDGSPGLMFPAFGDGSSTTFLCSDQHRLWEPSRASWEFEDPAELSLFRTVDTATGAAAPGWQVSSGNYTQALDVTDNLSVGNRRLKAGCVSTRVSTADAGESGIVFNYVDADTYYVFDVTPEVRRRIRRVVGGVSTTLSEVAHAHAASWSPAITLMVCFGDGIHTFLDDAASSRISVDTPVTFFGTGGRIGLWNSSNEGAMHEYLRSFPLVHGFSLLR